LRRFLITQSCVKYIQRLRSMSQFDEAFYRDLANYLYAVTQIEEVKNTPRGGLTL
jgi:hypothetical protein